jgi:hypothetical protein
MMAVILQRSAKFKIYMSHSLRDIKKTNSKKYEGVDEILLRQNFSRVELGWSLQQLFTNLDTPSDVVLQEK